MSGEPFITPNTSITFVFDFSRFKSRNILKQNQEPKVANAPFLSRQRRHHSQSTSPFTPFYLKWSEQRAEQQSRLIAPVLDTCAGNWWCRENTNRGRLPRIDSWTQKNTQPPIWRPKWRETVTQICCNKSGWFGFLFKYKWERGGSGEWISFHTVPEQLWSWALFCRRNSNSPLARNVARWMTNDGERTESAPQTKAPLKEPREQTKQQKVFTWSNTNMKVKTPQKAGMKMNK